MQNQPTQSSPSSGLCALCASVVHRLQSFLAVLAMASFVGAQAVLGPTTQPVPVDPSAAVNAVQALAQQANAQIAALTQQAAADAQVIRQQQQAQARSAGWLGVNDEDNAPTGINRWADLGRGMPGWYPQDRGGPPVQYSSRGYPIGASAAAPANAMTALYCHGVASQACRVTWTGHGAIHASGGGWAQAGPNAATLASRDWLAVDVQTCLRVGGMIETSN